MNRIDRLFDILLRLRRYKRIRAQDLADTYGVTIRTVYRDIAALLDMGVPVVSLPGEGYELMDGFYLPPLVFTPDEAGALTLGAQMLTRQSAGNLPDHARKAIIKIAAILPEATRARVDSLVQVIDFVMPDRLFDLEAPHILTLIDAIEAHRVVNMTYHSRNNDDLTTREVEPARLSYYNGAWYLSGYCRLREDQRSFRVNRIQTLKVLDSIFTLSESHDHNTSTQNNPSADLLTIRLRVLPDTVRWVRERQHYGYVLDESADATGTVMVYRVEQLLEIKAWILSWGAGVEILAPQAIREQIRAELQTVVDMLT